MEVPEPTRTFGSLPTGTWFLDPHTRRLALKTAGFHRARPNAYIATPDLTRGEPVTFRQDTMISSASVWAPTRRRLPSTGRTRKVSSIPRAYIPGGWHEHAVCYGTNVYAWTGYRVETVGTRCLVGRLTSGDWAIVRGVISRRLFHEVLAGRERSTLLPAEILMEHIEGSRTLFTATTREALRALARFLAARGYLMGARKDESPVRTIERALLTTEDLTTFAVVLENETRAVYWTRRVTPEAFLREGTSHVDLDEGNFATLAHYFPNLNS